MEHRKKVTIVTEAAIERLLIEQLEQIGVKGYTLLEVSGKGARGVRTGDWDQSRNIQIDIIGDEPLAQAIVRLCTEQYYERYAMIIYLSDVEVIRPEKF